MQIFAKVFQFKGFYIKNDTPMGGGWALGTKNQSLHAPEGEKVGVFWQGF